MNKVPLQVDTLVGHTADQLKSAILVKPTKEWFDKLPQDTLKHNNFITVAFCSCFEYSLINLNYFVRIIAKLYSLKDIDPPVDISANENLCINEDFNPEKTLIKFDEEDVLRIISYFCERIDERDLMILNCVKCWRKKMSLGFNNVANELINCYCVRQEYCNPSNKINSKFCKMINMYPILSKNNRFLFLLYIDAL